MDPLTIAAITELAKLGIQVYISYMKQAGLTDAQIDEAFQSARAGMIKRDPSLIPN